MARFLLKSCLMEACQVIGLVGGGECHNYSPTLLLTPPYWRLQTHTRARAYTPLESRLLHTHCKLKWFLQHRARVSGLVLNVSQCVPQIIALRMEEFAALFEASCMRPPLNCFPPLCSGAFLHGSRFKRA